MRKYATGWVATLFIGLLVLSFAIWGISDVFRGFNASEIARVGDTSIAVEDFQRNYTSRVQNLSSQIQQPITPDQARLFGIPNQVLGQMVSEASLNDRAKTFGLGISDETLSRLITGDPAFAGGGTRFSRPYFEQLLRANGLTETTYLRIRRQAELRQQIAESVAGGLNAPNTYRQALHEYQKDSRSVAFLTLPPSSVAQPADPDAEALQAYFAANQERWRAPEYRAVTVIAVEPANLANPDDVSEEQAREEYAANRQAYGDPERRRVDQIIFPNREEAEKAAAEIAAGGTFAAVAEGREVTELGLVSRDELIDPAVAEAAFALAAGAASGIVDSRFGPVLLQVTEIVPESIKPFEEVAADIRQEIAARNAATDILDEHDRIEDARAGGSTLAEIAQRFELPLVKIEAVDAQGNDPEGNPVTGIPEGSNLVAEAFASEVGVETDVVQFGNSGFAWFQVDEVIASRERTLDEVRDQVVEAWRNDQIAAALDERAAGLAEQVRSGTSLEEIATAEGLGPVQTKDGLTRITDDPAPLPPELLQSVFGGPVGHVAVAAAGDSYVLLTVTGADTPPYEESDEANRQLAQQAAQSLGSDVLQQYIGALQQSLGVTVNQTAVQAIVGGSTF